MSRANEQEQNNCLIGLAVTSEPKMLILFGSYCESVSIITCSMMEYGVAGVLGHLVTPGLEHRVGTGYAIILLHNMEDYPVRVEVIRKRLDQVLVHLSLS